jgi:hypothetical protein
MIFCPIPLRIPHGLFNFLGKLSLKRYMQLNIKSDIFIWQQEKQKM